MVIKALNYAIAISQMIPGAMCHLPSAFITGSHKSNEWSESSGRFHSLTSRREDEIKTP